MLDSRLVIGHHASLSVPQWALASLLGVVLLGCGEPSNALSDVHPTAAPTTAAPTTTCDKQSSVTLLDGAMVEVPTLGEFGQLGASVLIVQVGSEPPLVAEDPLRSPVVYAPPAPFVVTRYDVTVTQLVVWPDTARTPAVGDRMSLDVGGGTLGCFTLVVPNAVTLEAGGSYLVAAGVRDPDHLVLWDNGEAMTITDGVIGSGPPGLSLPEALLDLTGQQLDALPPLSVVASDLIP